MTSITMLTYQWVTKIDYDSLEFNPDELQLPPDAMFQNPAIMELMAVMPAHFTDENRRPDVFLDFDTPVCYDPGNLNVRVAPDCYIAFGVDAHAIRRRKLYLPWEAGKPPDFVLEVASESTARNDVNEKRLIYAQIGVGEYWLFDPSGGDLYGQPLKGERLMEGVYQPFDLTAEGDGVLKAYSPTLALYLCWQVERLRFYDPETGTYLRNMSQTQDALRVADTARREAEAALRAKRVAREADHARIRQLEEELRHLQSEG